MRTIGLSLKFNATRRCRFCTHRVEMLQEQLCQPYWDAKMSSISIQHATIWLQYWCKLSVWTNCKWRAILLCAWQQNSDKPEVKCSDWIKHMPIAQDGGLCFWWECQDQAHRSQYVWCSTYVRSGRCGSTEAKRIVRICTALLCRQVFKMMQEPSWTTQKCKLQQV